MGRVSVAAFIESACMYSLWLSVCFGSLDRSGMNEPSQSCESQCAKYV